MVNNFLFSSSKKKNKKTEIAEVQIKCFLSNMHMEKQQNSLSYNKS